MSVTWHLRGYDRHSELLATQYEIPLEMLATIRAIVAAEDNDPAMLDPRELSWDQTVRLAQVSGWSIDPNRFDYFIEADEDWRVVEAKREALAAAA
jgi:hypothetical protein